MIGLNLALTRNRLALRWLYLDAYSPTDMFGQSHSQPFGEEIQKRDEIKIFLQ